MTSLRCPDDVEILQCVDDVWILQALMICKMNSVTPFQLSPLHSSSHCASYDYSGMGWRPGKGSPEGGIILWTLFSGDKQTRWDELEFML